MNKLDVNKPDVNKPEARGAHGAWCGLCLVVIAMTAGCLGPEEEVDTSPIEAAAPQEADVEQALVGDRCTAASQCNDGNPCTVDSCTRGFCSYQNARAGTTCDDGNACTIADTCSAGTCSGKAVSCSDSNSCTVDTCDPSVGCRYTPGNAGSVCRASTGGCDVAETCTGTSATCPADGFAAAGSVCRAPAGECDVAETCSGTSATCPRDALLPKNAVCSDDGNPCTTDKCSGKSVNCGHAAGNAGAVCRGAAGECDVTETCTGSSTSCPVDAFVPSTTVCRSATDDCDATESCTGSAAACPADADEPDGTTCDDANLATVQDQCTGGTCAGIDLCAGVVCLALDQCHQPGTCDPMTGLCSNPALPNGTSCNDGDACTQTDTCEAGTCTGDNPVVCTALDQCHDAGTCNPSTGECSNPAAPNGTSCNDGDACTQTDTCAAGTCTGADPVVCTALDECHELGTCDASTGACSNPAALDGMVCDDDNAGTVNDECTDGTCAGTDRCADVVCAALDECHVAGTCDSLTGFCSDPAAPDGTSCNDGDACTQVDTCDAGACTGTSPVVCDVLDQCHDGGTCDPATGVCSDPAAADGTLCDDGDPLTTGEECVAGACVGGNQTDPCSEGNGGCDPLATCTNVDGLPSCECPADTVDAFGDGTECRNDAVFCHDIGFSGLSSAGGQNFPDGCPTGASAFCDTKPIRADSRAQALLACESCMGVGNCHEESADCAGLGFGPRPAGQYRSGDPYWGFQTGCSGDSGRVWAISHSFDSFGRWAPPLPPCGDDVLGVGEECDDGNRVAGDGCSAICEIEACGNGRLDAGEQCDDDNDVDNDGCTNCLLPVCGDKVVDATEACDDGNRTAGDGCRADCKGTEACGDGQVDAGEACDGEPDCGCDCTTFLDHDPMNCGACGNECGDDAPFCANGTCAARVPITRPNEGYGSHGACGGWNACGDAQTCALWACQINGYDRLVSYGREAPCTELGVCHLFYGSGPESGIQWRWGNWCPVMGVTDVVCDMHACGDGVVDADEECDDGNATDHDSCSASCKIEFCGDAIVNGAEECDDGNDIDDDGCSECFRIGCGDRFDALGGLGDGAGCSDAEQEGCSDCGDGDPACVGGVNVASVSEDLPRDIVGHYTESFTCSPEEGGASFEGADSAHCFRLEGTSPWLIWNTGCGWELGRQEQIEYDPSQTMWKRYARTYSGLCSEIAPEQLDTRALTTTVFYDSFGEPMTGLSSVLIPCVVPLDGSSSNLELNFDVAVNPSGAWRYGNASGADGPFSLFPHIFDDGSGALGWTDNSLEYYLSVRNNPTSEVIFLYGSTRMSPGQVFLHPDDAGRDAVVEWVAPTAGTYHAEATFRGDMNNCGPTTDAHVLQGNDLGYIELAGGAVTHDTPFSTTTSATLDAGDTLRFAVGFGENRNYVCDSTALEVTITPE